MNRFSQPNITYVISKYRGTRLYKWLEEDIDYINTIFGNNIEAITDQWIMSNYSCYETSNSICRVDRNISNYSCIKCKSRYVSVGANQGRRSDESSTTTYTCISCGHTSISTRNKF